MTANAGWTQPIIRRGLALRIGGLSYEAIAVVLRDYHGLHADGEAVRKMLRRHGATARPMGPAERNFARSHT